MRNWTGNNIHVNTINTSTLYSVYCLFGARRALNILTILENLLLSSEWRWEMGILNFLGHLHFLLFLYMYSTEVIELKLKYLLFHWQTQPHQHSFKFSLTCTIEYFFKIGSVKRARTAATQILIYIVQVWIQVCISWCWWLLTSRSEVMSWRIPWWSRRPSTRTPRRISVTWWRWMTGSVLPVPGF